VTDLRISGLSNGATPSANDKLVVARGSGNVFLTWAEFLSAIRSDLVPYRIPEWFGAAGDGTTDDTAAIRTALADLPAAGGTVMMTSPSGYAISSTAGNVALDLGLKKKLQGRGNTAPGLIYSGAGYAVQIGVPGQTVAPLPAQAGISDLKISGGGPSVAGSLGIRVIKCLFPNIRDVAVENIESGLVLDASDLWIASGHVIGLTTNGVAAGITITGNVSKQVNQMTFLGGYIGGSSIANGYGVKVGGTSFYNPSGVDGQLHGSNKFLGTHFEGFTGTGAWGINVYESDDPGCSFISNGCEACTGLALLDTKSTGNSFVDFAEQVTDNGIANIVATMHGRQVGTRYQPGSGGAGTTWTPDMGAEGTFKVLDVTGVGTLNIANPINVKPGQELIMLLRQGASGTTVTFGTKYRIPAGIVAACATASKHHTLRFLYNSFDDLWGVRRRRAGYVDGRSERHSCA
jgi:hypothetical protein